MKTDAQTWLAAVRTSHDRLQTLTEKFDGEGLRQPSYAAEWSVAQTLSHLGSQAEIFGLFLDSALEGYDPPGTPQFGPIWDRWNAKSPEQQAADAIAVDEGFVARVESMDENDRARVQLHLFGTDLDLAGLLRMRLSEHALHTWDVAVALDASAQVSPDAVELLIDTLRPLVERSGRRHEGPAVVEIRTSEPDHAFRLKAAGEGLMLAESKAGTPPDATVTMPAEAFIRLVYGRLDAAHTPAVQAEGVSLDELRAAFPGF